MNVSLTKHYEHYIQEKVESGQYFSASEVVRDALRLLEEEDHLRKIREDELRKAIAEGRASGAANPWNIEEFLKMAHEKADRMDAKK